MTALVHMFIYIYNVRRHMSEESARRERERLAAARAQKTREDQSANRRTASVRMSAAPPAVILRVKRRRDDTHDSSAAETSLPTHVHISSSSSYSSSLFASLSLSDDVVTRPRQRRRRFVRVNDEHMHTTSSEVIHVSLPSIPAKTEAPDGAAGKAREEPNGSILNSADDNDDDVFEYATYVPADVKMDGHESETHDEEWDLEKLAGEDGDTDALHRLLRFISRDEALDACGLSDGDIFASRDGEADSDYAESDENAEGYAYNDYPDETDDDESNDSDCFHDDDDDDDEYD